MAPREATGAFPDQYLTFDYDNTAAMGMPPPQHEPQPPAAPPMQQPATPNVVDIQHQAGSDGINLTGSSTTIPGSQSSNVNTNTSQQQQQPVDPLSIDPTLLQPPPMWRSVSDHSAVTTTSAPTPPLPSDLQQPSLHHGISTRRTVRSASAPISVESSRGLLSANLHQVNSDNNGTASPSLSTGSFPNSLTATPNTPHQSHDRQPQSPLSSLVPPSLIGQQSPLPTETSPASASSAVASSSASPPTTTGSATAAASSISSRSTQQQPPITTPSPSHRITRRRPFHTRSVLDSATSLDEDSDDENDGDVVRALDRTFDSTTSYGNNTSANSSFMDCNDDGAGNDALNVSDITTFGVDDDNNDPKSKNKFGKLSSSDKTSSTHIITDGSSDEDNNDEENDQIMEMIGRPSPPTPESPSPENDSNASSNSSTSSGSLRMIYHTSAFESSSVNTHSSGSTSSPPPQPAEVGAAAAAASGSPTSPNSILLSFGANTTVSDLKYFAERGCIVALLQALTTPRLITLGTRMLADYAKMPHRRVAVASNRRILEFVQRTMLQVTEVQPDWLGREYAVETVRSLTATEESDRYLMGTPGLLSTLALVAHGGPYLTHVNQETGVRTTVPLASEKARLHACIAIMNLSCGKANKIEIAKLPDVLESMRDVMLNSSSVEARLKATTCIKNLSNADANDAALLGTPGLVEALGHVAAITCTPENGATTCTTNACLALMNLSISKQNKHRVFRTPGVMDALMTVLERTTAQGSSNEARIKACSALSNLAIGYDNKIPMFAYTGFVDAILNVIQTDTGEARTKACSILWSFAAEMKNQVPVVQRGDVLPTLVQVAEEDGTTEARFKCVAALTLLAESLENALPLLESGALVPLMDILHEAGPDPTQWKGQTASWCVGFLMNIAQSDEAVPHLREAGVVELLAPLLTLDHYQSLKAAMAVTFVCRYDEGDETYDLLRKTENVIPKIIGLLHNTLNKKGGNGYKYGVFTLRSSVGCIASLASGPDFMKERIATNPVFESLIRVITDFCVQGGTSGEIVGGGRDDIISARLAMKALQSLTEHLIPIVGSSQLPFGSAMEERSLIALEAFENCANVEVSNELKELATDARVRIHGGKKAAAARARNATSGLLSCGASVVAVDDGDVDMSDVASLASTCCGFDTLPNIGGNFLHSLTLPSHLINQKASSQASVSTPSSSPRTIPGSPSMSPSIGNSVLEDSKNIKHGGVDDCNSIKTTSTPRRVSQSNSSASLAAFTTDPVRTFLLADIHTGRRYAVPLNPSGGRMFNDQRVWCYRRGRFCLDNEEPDPNFVWTNELQIAYENALATGNHSNGSTATASPGSVIAVGSTAVNGQ